MLQQTQVKTVIPYFNNFTKKYKTLKSLSQCGEKEILKMWEGLGYYRRARNLLATARILVKIYKFKLPKSLIEIKKLPGIGEYTGNALLALVHNKPTIAVDGNVKRVLARYLNIKEIKINFDELIELNRDSFFNSNRNSDLVEALMEFGALVCKPKNPRCETCCLKKSCKYFYSPKKIKNDKKKIIKLQDFDIFCYINKKKQIALTKKKQLSFLRNFNLPKIQKSNKPSNNKHWKFLNNYKSSVSNLKMNINLYYKFSNKIPTKYNWFELDENKDFIPSFTKKIFRQVTTLF